VLALARKRCCCADCSARFDSLWSARANVCGQLPRHGPLSNRMNAGIWRPCSGAATVTCAFVWHEIFAAKSALCLFSAFRRPRLPSARNSAVGRRLVAKSEEREAAPGEAAPPPEPDPEGKSRGPGRLPAAAGIARFRRRWVISSRFGKVSKPGHRRAGVCPARLTRCANRYRGKRGRFRSGCSRCAGAGCNNCQVLRDTLWFVNSPAQWRHLCPAQLTTLGKSRASNVVLSRAYR